MKLAAAQARERLNKRNMRCQHVSLKLIEIESQLKQVPPTQLADDRTKAISDYKNRHNCDPTPFVDEAWMSDQVSGIETEDDTKATAHVASLQRAAGLSKAEVEDKVEVFERVQWSFRSAEVNFCIFLSSQNLLCERQVDQVMEELDDIRREQRRKGKGKPRPRTKRVNLGRKNNALPTVSVYPCMIDEDWYEEWVNELALGDELEIFEEDPEGFGEKVTYANATSEQLIAGSVVGESIGERVSEARVSLVPAWIPVPKGTSDTGGDDTDNMYA